MIAGALVLEPQVIVADEPVSNLDASVGGESGAADGLRRELKISIFIVTHDLGLAWTVADRVAVMYLGRIVEIGPADDVLLRPKHPYTKALLDVVPEAGGLERPTSRARPRPDADPDGCRFHPRCPVVVSGRARELGIEPRCIDEPLEIIGETGTTQAAACYLVPLGERP